MTDPHLPDNAGIIGRPPLLYLAALLVALAAHAIWPQPVIDRRTGVLAGVPLVALGLGVAIWGRRTMQKAGTNVNPMRPATTIVSSGPFRFSRNPLYVCLTVIYIGLTLAFNTWWGFVV